MVSVVKILPMVITPYREGEFNTGPSQDGFEQASSKKQLKETLEGAN